jgi:hypothetical protein
MTTSLGHEASLTARYFALHAQLDLVDPRYVNDRAVDGEGNKFPRAIVRKGVILIMHFGLPIGGLSSHILAHLFEC